MTDLVDPVRHAATPANRLEPVVFAHAQIAMLTSTTAGVVVDVNAAGIELFGRDLYELVQEMLDDHLVPLTGLRLVDCLREASTSTGPISFGSCAVRRRGGCETVRELVVSSGCLVTGRDLLLVQLPPERIRSGG